MTDSLKLHMAAYIALIEYTYMLLLIQVVVTILWFFVFFNKDAQVFLQLAFALFMGNGLTYMFRRLVFSRIVLKKYSKEELKQLWLTYGGFTQK